MDAATSKRPQRWDEPFGQSMTDAQVERLLERQPFAGMDPGAFPEPLPLREILRNDARIVEFEEGDIVIREGDYGNSAFLVLDGRVDVSLKSLPENLLGRATAKKRGWLRTVAQLWSNHRGSEVRTSANALGGSFGARQAPDGTRVFVQDVAQVLDSGKVVTIGKGELFGELAAFSRSPRTATVIARGKTELLEIRWQGLRDLIKHDPILRNYLDQLYRDNSLLVHLRETPFLNELGAEDLQVVADSAMFHSFGEFDWQNDFRKINRKDVGIRIEQEPLICREGDYVNDLILIRNGFGRLSRQVGNGHQTLAYLGKGEVYGLKEIADDWHARSAPRPESPSSNPPSSNPPSPNPPSPNPPSPNPPAVGSAIGADVEPSHRPFQFSLRAVGHVETITIPAPIVEQVILPNLSEDSVQQLLSQNWLANLDVATEPRDAEDEIETGLIEFLGEYRFINGTQTMLIDLDRCTRCDDCVRACADTHDNNPRFNRQGPKFGNQMVASACMHCIDPVCMIGCPTGAIGRDMSTGNILINDQTCIGCSTCANSCPYDNIQMVEISDRQGNPIVDEESKLPILKATKCDLCTDQPGGPACVRACPHDAMIRLNMNDASSLSKWIQR